MSEKDQIVGVKKIKNPIGETRPVEIVIPGFKVLDINVKEGKVHVEKDGLISDIPIDRIVNIDKNQKG